MATLAKNSPYSAFRAEPAYFEYDNLKAYTKVPVKILEQLDYGIEDYRPVEAAPIPNLPETVVQESQQPIVMTPAAQFTEQHKPAPEIAPENLSSTVKEICMNQRGVSYVKLFGLYLRNAKKVELTDPFVRLPYQIDNLIEFINAVRQSVENPEGLEIHLSTANGDEHRPDDIDIFDAITDDLAPLGIAFVREEDSI